jgi:eukaryotic-like serine/threonine-protein kinase
MGNYLDGRYEILKQIGGDGFGITYLVLDSKRPGSPECIAKQLRPDRHDPKFIELFEREATALEKLGEHPRIPRLLAHFEENRNFYIIQEKIDGDDLRQEIGQHRRSERYAVELLHQVLTVLEFVHDRNIIHRDLKPGNLMRHRDGRIFLIDFGIIKELSTMVLGSDKAGRSTISIGTLGYCAPEQGMGKPRYSSDLYSLGMTVIYALTNIHPRDLKEDLVTGEVVWQKGMTVSPELAAILTKMVRQRWVDRYQDAGQALQALNDLIAEREKPPNPPPMLDPEPKPNPRLTPKPNKPAVVLSAQSAGRRGVLKWLGYGGMGLASASIGSGVSLWLASNQTKDDMSSSRSSEPTFRGAADAAKGATSTPEATSNLVTRRVEFPTVTVNETGKSLPESKGQVTVYSDDLGNGIMLTMASLPGGTFMMGSPTTEDDRETDEGPQHSVRIPGFWMGQFEVTQAQWSQVAKMEKVSIDLNPDPANFKGPNRPVEQVSWDEATEFCARLSRATNRAYRLPSEAEWEYACRAGTDTPFSFGPTLNPDVANYNGNYTYGQGTKGKYRQGTTDVGSFPANAFGLYDMHGNVWEWCQDWWNDDYSKAPTDGNAQLNQQSDKSYRLLRGGTWDNYPRYCRSAFRHGISPGRRSYYIGFRVACSLAS